MSFPQIQMNTQPMMIEYNQASARLEITPAKPEFSYNSEFSKFEVNIISPSNLEIDQERAWQASGLGGNQYFTSQIYSESKQILMQALAKRAQEGDRMTKIKAPSAIAEIHAGKPLEELPFNYVGAGSVDNVDLNYQKKEIEIRFSPGTLDIGVELNPPKIEFTPSSFDIYIKQMNSLNITPPEINLFI